MQSKRVSVPAEASGNLTQGRWDQIAWNSGNPQRSYKIHALTRERVWQRPRSIPFNVEWDGHGSIRAGECLLHHPNAATVLADRHVWPLMRETWTRGCRAKEVKHRVKGTKDAWGLLLDYA